MTASFPTALLIDGDAILRRAVRALLQEQGVAVVGEAASAERALVLAAETKPDVIVLAAPPRGRAGVDLTRRVLKGNADARVVILSRSGRGAGAAAAMITAGACGYLLSDDPPEEIAAGIRAAAAGGSPFSPRVAAALLEIVRPEVSSVAYPELTCREREVLELLADGHSNPEIAARLSISVPTVKRHLSHLLLKLRATNRTQAAVKAVRQGLL